MRELFILTPAHSNGLGEVGQLPPRLTVEAVDLGRLVGLAVVAGVGGQGATGH